MDVLTKSAPASSAARQAATISSSVSAADSMITLSTAPGMASRTARISAAVWAASPDLRRPMSMTMSTSSAPAATDPAASNALTSAVCLPEGKPQTVAILTSPVGQGSGSIDGLMQME